MNFEDKPIFFKPKPLSANKELMAKLLTKRFNMIDAYRPNENDFSELEYTGNN
jgi:hypothetical protein